MAELLISGPATTKTITALLDADRGVVNASAWYGDGAVSAHLRGSNGCRPTPRWPSVINDNVGVVYEHKPAVVQLNRPPSRWVGDVLGSDIHPTAGGISEVFDDNTQRLSFGVWEDPYSHIRGDGFAATLTKPSHFGLPPLLAIE